MAYGINVWIRSVLDEKADSCDAFPRHLYQVLLSHLGLKLVVGDLRLSQRALIPPMGISSLSVWGGIGSGVSSSMQPASAMRVRTSGFMVAMACSTGSKCDASLKAVKSRNWSSVRSPGSSRYSSISS